MLERRPYSVSVFGLGCLVGSVWITGGVLLFEGLEDYDQFRLWVFYISLTVGIPYLFILTKDIKWDHYIGEISYPLYLVHGLIIGAISPFLRSFSPSIKTVLILFATILISIGIYVFVDRPIDRFRHKFARGVGRAANLCGPSRRNWPDSGEKMPF